MNFSKWNKRITAWLLLIAGFYMGIMQYEVSYVVIFLGSGLAAIGLSIWQSKGVKFGDHPPPDDDDDDPPPGGKG